MLEHGKESFLAIDDMLGPGESVAGQECAFCPHPSRPWINRVLHVGQLARCHRARAKCSRRTDTDGGHHLLWREIQHPARRDWRRESAQGGMMPPVFAHAWSSHFAEP